MPRGCCAADFLHGGMCHFVCVLNWCSRLFSEGDVALIVDKVADRGLYPNRLLPGAGWVTCLDFLPAFLNF